MQYRNQVPLTLPGRQASRVLHSTFHIAELVVADRHGQAVKLWNAGICDIAERHWLRSPGASVNHSLSASVAMLLMEGRDDGLTNWLNTYGVRGKLPLLANELLGGYGNWIIALLMAARWHLSPRVSSVYTCTVDTIEAIALMSALTAVHAGDDSATWTGGAPYHVLAPGGRWGLSQRDGGRGQIDLRTNILGCLLSPTPPAPLKYKQLSTGGDNQHPANRLARHLAPVNSLNEWRDYMLSLIYSPSASLAERLVNRLNELNVRVQATFSFTRVDRHRGYSWVPISTPDRDGWGYTAGTSRTPCVAMSKLSDEISGESIYAWPFAGRDLSTSKLSTSHADTGLGRLLMCVNDNPAASMPVGVSTDMYTVQFSPDGNTTIA